MRQKCAIFSESKKGTALLDYIVKKGTANWAQNINAILDFNQKYEMTLGGNVVVLTVWATN